ncbi:hypothetical protein D9757_000513 [Collybiopsis confluens]|uniref:Uncharacterized protein n=1 Tax=Collybiopsis confluens TaxID=2823264 RepID=A0A8H5I137_9AGAR|nr:hypothetical protein D9757_000513 [Collybiopsis confluens]
MQRAFSVRRLSAPRYAYSTRVRLNATSAINSTPKTRVSARTPRDAAEARIGYDGGPNSVRLRFFHAPRNSADVLASVKYMETLCGPIDEFSCGAYGDRKSGHLYIRFRDYDSATRAKSYSPSHIRIPAPDFPTPNPLEGGISLESLEPLLDVQSHDPELKPVLENPNPNDRFDYKTSENREHLYFTNPKTDDCRSAPPIERGEYLSQNAKRKFVEWAGFVPLKPLPPDAPLLEQGDAVDHPIMRHVVQRYVTMLNHVRNPLQSTPGQQQQSTFPEEPQRGQQQSGGGITWTREPKSTSASARAVVEKLKLVEPELSAVVDTPTVQISAAEAPTPAASPDVSSPALPSPPPTTSPLPPPPIAPARPPPPSASPEAQAQVLAANSILRRINRSKSGNNKAQAPANGTAAEKSRRPAPQKLPAQAEESNSPSPPQGEVVRQQPSEGTTAKVRGFMGKWFS